MCMYYMLCMVVMLFRDNHSIKQCFNILVQVRDGYAGNVILCKKYWLAICGCMQSLTSGCTEVMEANNERWYTNNSTGRLNI